MKTLRIGKRTSATAVRIAIVVLVALGLSAYSPNVRAQGNDGAAEELAARLETICRRAGTTVGVAVTHVETGRSVSVEGAKQLPLHSVYKLPLAIAVLKDVEENRLRLDKKVRITPAEVAPGGQSNTELWRKPVVRSVQELLELSMVQSDNTSSDKLLEIIGGPAVVMQRMRSFGFTDMDIRSSAWEIPSQRGRPSTGTASELAHLLARLQKGEILQPPQLTLLLDFMEGATTGLRRLRGDLPPGTEVGDKTGTGREGSATNDVGLITLPEGKGHLAMAVLLSGSKLSAEAQEKLIAELARAAYDAHVSRAAQGKQ